MTPVAIRPATTADWPAIWAILAPVFRAGDTYTIDPDISEADAERYWMTTGRPYVAERDGAILGTFYIRTNQQGGGAHFGEGLGRLHALGGSLQVGAILQGRVNQPVERRLIKLQPPH